MSTSLPAPSRARLVIAPLLWLASTVDAAPPPLDEIRRLIDAAPSSHPSLLADAGLFRRLAATDVDARTSTLRAGVLERARGLLATEPVTHVVTGRRLLAVSREALLRITALAAASRLTDDPLFAARAEAELLAVCAFPDWNPAHFLDTAEMTLAVALGYDWLHDRLPADTLRTAREAILRLGIEPSFARRHGWISNDNNWNQVCHAGMVAGALALRGSEPDLAARVVHRAVVNLPIAMRASYAPDGAYPEGPGYWSYGTTFNVILLDTLRSVLGTSFALERVEGFPRTGDYLAQVAGPTGLRFNYADSREEPDRFEPALYWLAAAFARPDWSARADRLGADAARRDLERRRFAAFALLWGATAPPGATAYPDLDFVARGHKPVAVFRSAWDDPAALHLGVCGGTPGSNHGQMDVGSFVLDALGVRWSVDPGVEGYHGIESRGMNLWDRSQDGDRWTIFRLNHQGHSTLVLDDAPQRTDGFAEFTSVETGAGSPGCVLDLTPLHAGRAARVIRSFTLPDRRAVVIRDRIDAATAATVVRWQMLTRARVKHEDGPVAMLEQDGRRLLARILAPDGARWSVREAADLMRDFDTPDPALRRLEAGVAVGAGASLELVVELIPQRDAGS